MPTNLSGDMVTAWLRRRRSAPAKKTPGCGRAGGRSRDSGAYHSDLGVLRDVASATAIRGCDQPTYSGCPAMNMIALEIDWRSSAPASRRPKIRTVLSPAWTTDWMSEKRKKSKLRRSRAGRLQARPVRCS